MNNKRWVDLTEAEQLEIYKAIDEGNADYMKSLSSPETYFGDWYYYENDHGRGLRRDVIGHGVTTKNWSYL